MRNPVKKNNYVKRGLYGLVIAVLIVIFLKILLRERPVPLHEGLTRIATETNKHAPRLLDSTTRLEYVNAMTNGVMQYNYKLISLDRFQLDTSAFKDSIKAKMTEKFLTDPQMSYLKKNAIVVEFRYVDRSNQYVCVLSFGPQDY